MVSELSYMQKCWGGWTIFLVERIWWIVYSMSINCGKMNFEEWFFCRQLKSKRNSQLFFRRGFVAPLVKNQKLIHVDNVMYPSSVSFFGYTDKSIIGRYVRFNVATSILHCAKILGMAAILASLRWDEGWPDRNVVVGNIQLHTSVCGGYRKSTIPNE